jgi:hypothetical protein
MAAFFISSFILFNPLESDETNPLESNARTPALSLNINKRDLCTNITRRCSSEAEQLIRNQQVVGSTPTTGSNNIKGLAVFAIFLCATDEFFTYHEFSFNNSMSFNK